MGDAGLDHRGPKRQAESLEGWGAPRMGSGEAEAHECGSWSVAVRSGVAVRWL